MVLHTVVKESGAKMSGTNNSFFFLEQQFYSSYLRWQNTSVILIFCFQISIQRKQFAFRWMLKQRYDMGDYGSAEKLITKLTCSKI